MNHYFITNVLYESTCLNEFVGLKLYYMWFVVINYRFNVAPWKGIEGVKSHDGGSQLTGPFLEIIYPPECYII